MWKKSNAADCPFPLNAASPILASASDVIERARPTGVQLSPSIDHAAVSHEPSLASLR
jgi:hypothetical protein